jgi:hypothetical protein
MASGAPVLTVESLTWDVVGLVSNDPTDGPDTFPVGARVCNEGSIVVDNLVAVFVWDSANPVMSLDGPDKSNLSSLGVGDCHDFYFNVAIQRTPAVFETTRSYHIEVTADEISGMSTAQPRQLYVEKLISQSRNSINEISGPGGLGDPPATEVYVGETHTYQLHGRPLPGV